MNKKNTLITRCVRKLIQEVINTSDWQFTNTDIVLKSIGYKDFIASLSEQQLLALKRELSHHLNTGLTTVKGHVKHRDFDRANAAVDNAIKRDQWLIDVLTSK